MSRIEFIPVDIGVHRDELVQLNVEYMSWVLAEMEKLFAVPAGQILGMPAADYVPTVVDKLCGATPPLGVFYLVTVDERIAGMGGLRSLGEVGGEIKRIYCRPEFRGQGIGKQVLQRLLSDAKAFGYKNAVLDSALFMKSAHRLYESAGFVDRSPYEGAEVPVQFQKSWRFMERSL